MEEVTSGAVTDRFSIHFCYIVIIIEYRVYRVRSKISINHKIQIKNDLFQFLKYRLIYMKSSFISY